MAENASSGGAEPNDPIHRGDGGYRGWIVVLGSVLGLTVGSGAIKIFAFSALLKPTSDAIDMPRATIGLAFLIGNMVGMVFTPIYGRLIDQFGVRLISIPTVLLWSLTMAVFACLQPENNYLIFPLYIASGIFSVAQTPISYSKAITTWFESKRGLALGLGVSGVGLGGFLMPQYVHYVSSAYGWRAAYLAIAVAIAALAVPSFAFMVRSRRVAGHESRRPVQADGALRLEIIRATLRERVFWTLAVMFFFAVAAINGVITHLMALLTDKGVDGATAAAALSVAGGTVIVGRIAGGYLLDKVRASFVACFFFVLPAIGCGLLASSSNEILLLIAAIGLGLGVGAEFDVLGYLIGRYFPLSAYGTIYGMLFSLITLATAGGPFAVGLLAGVFHGYGGALVTAGVTSLACGLLALTLRRDRDRLAVRPYELAGRSM